MSAKSRTATRFTENVLLRSSFVPFYITKVKAARTSLSSTCWADVEEDHAVSLQRREFHEPDCYFCSNGLAQLQGGGRHAAAKHVNERTARGISCEDDTSFSKKIATTTLSKMEAQASPCYSLCLGVMSVTRHSRQSAESGVPNEEFERARSAGSTLRLLRARRRSPATWTTRRARRARRRRRNDRDRLAARGRRSRSAPAAKAAKAVAVRIDIGCDI